MNEGQGSQEVGLTRSDVHARYLDSEPDRSADAGPPSLPSTQSWVVLHINALWLDLHLNSRVQTMFSDQNINTYSPDKSRRLERDLSLLIAHPDIQAASPHY